MIKIFDIFLSLLFLTEEAYKWMLELIPNNKIDTINIFLIYHNCVYNYKEVNI